jgi:hypothetical protein
MFTVHQHWDPLKVCAVGRSYPPDFYSNIKNPKVRSVMERIAIETEEDYQKLIKKLEEFNVTVIRTDISDDYEVYVDKNSGLSYPPPMCPRDHTAMVGNRFFMPGRDYGFNIRKLQEYYSTRIQDNYDLQQKLIRSETLTIGSNIKYPNNTNFYSFDTIEKFLLEHDIPIVYNQYINAASMTRVGKDLYFGWINNNNDNYPFTINFCKKISKLFPEYKNNFINFAGHTDGVFCPVKPGLIISLKEIQTYEDSFPGWEVIYLPNQSWSKVKPFLDLKKKNKGKWWIPGEEDNNDLIDYIETWLKDWTTYVEETVFDVNILVIDEHNVICNNYNKDVFEAFERHNITPHIINFRHRYFWDGGLHCITSDIAREGEQKDYFPNRKRSNAYLHSTPDKIVVKSW